MRYRQLFAHREFRALFAADVLSIAGTYLARVAVASLVFQRTGSAALTALTFAISYLPFVFSPWLARVAGGPLCAPVTPHRLRPRPRRVHCLDPGPRHSPGCCLGAALR